LHGAGIDLAQTLVSGYSIDSRTLHPGELFFAVRGERFDAHDFIEMAIVRGACAAVVSKNKVLALPEAVRQYGVIVVEDPLIALQTLANVFRRHWGGRVIAITGSAGKTTTKDAIAAVLSTRVKVLKSEGNLNNQFGLPLQLLKLKREHGVVVLEMGMSNAGEITSLVRIAGPEWGVVTNVGNAHAENFPEGIVGVARAKYELIRGLPGGGIAFLNCDDPYVSQFGRGFVDKAVIYFGRGVCADPRAIEVEELGASGMRLIVRSGEEETDLHLKLLGRHNVTNVLAAIAIGREYSIPLDVCARALTTLEPGDKRGQTIQLHGATMINDCYNSNPEALKAMIHTLMSIPGQRHILVAGEMLELGRKTVALHASCGETAASAGVDIVLGVQGSAVHIVDAAEQAGAEAIFMETPELAGVWLQRNLREKDVVLLKASRGVRLERALDELKAN